MDFRRSHPVTVPLTMLNSTVSVVEFSRFLVSTISLDLKLESIINTVIKKAWQRS